MDRKILLDKSKNYMQKFCIKIKKRCVGSHGNRQATEYFEDILSSLDWKTELQEFSAMDWNDGKASLNTGSQNFKVFVSPYSLGFSGSGELVSISNMTELKENDLNDKIVLLHGEIAKEQLMPKNFVFYNPKEHQQIISLLENSKVKAIICVTGRNGALAGGVYPFPLIEDGDFDIPSVYMTEEEGDRFLKHVGEQVILNFVSKRIYGKGCNVIGKKGANGSKRVVITAHIDSKKGTPGAIDNATGVSVLLILAELLNDYSGNKQIEIVAFNGEDYYSVPGQMKYIIENKDKFDDILLNINIDGAAYKEGKTAFSFFDLHKELKKKAINTIDKYPDIVEGIKWPQGDHSIFVQNKRPAIAISSKWFIENIESQDITHTQKDNLDIVDYSKIVIIAEAINDFVRMI